MNRSVVITGASTGIGAASAVEMARRGWRVFAGVRRTEDGQRLHEQAPRGITPLQLDVTDAGQIAAAVGRVAEALGQERLTGLVNNAGIAVAGPLEILPLPRWREQLEVNVLGTVAVTQAFLPMLRHGDARIVNMSSISGRIAVPFLGPYSASKFALEALTDAMRGELHAWGVRVSLIQPASIATPIWDKSRIAADAATEGVPAELLALYEEDLERFRKAVLDRGETGLPVERVVRAVVRALCDRRPKIRYLVGSQALLVRMAVRWLPDRVRDWLVRREMGLK